MIDNPIILALDFADLKKARDILTLVRPHVGMIKIGLELFTAHGKDCITLSQEFDIPVFLDLKLHDVPTTVAKTVEVICTHFTRTNLQDPHFLSVHCFGGKEMCKAALDVANGSNVKIAGVTILTSLTERDLGSFGFRDTRIGSRTVDIAELGKEAGIDTFISAPNQLPLMRKYLGDQVSIITPGIRSDADEQHDHKRTKTPGFAMKNGANWIVVGRPITQADDLLAMAQYFKHQAMK